VSTQQTPPPPPQNLRSETIGTDRVTLTWNNAGSGITYRVYFFGNPVTGISVNITNLISGTTYFFWVSSLRDGLESAKSNVLSVMTTIPQAVAPPPIPQNLRCEIIGTDKVTLTWNSAGSGLSYRVYYSTQNNSYSARIFSNPTTATALTIPDLAGNSTYYFWVTSLQGGLESEKSTVVSVWIPSPPTSGVVETKNSVSAESKKMPGKTEISLSYQTEGTKETAIFCFSGGMYWLPLSFINIGLEGRYGFSRFPDPDSPKENDIETIYYYYGGSPVLGLQFPIGNKIHIFSNFLLEMGKFGAWNGMITDWMTPGFDAGLSFELATGAYMTIKYRGIILKDTYRLSLTNATTYSSVTPIKTTSRLRDRLQN